MYGMNTMEAVALSKDLNAVFRGWEAVKLSRYWGLCDTIWYYLDLIHGGHTLNDLQRTQLKEARDTISAFGMPGALIVFDVNEAIKLD